VTPELIAQIITSIGGTVAILVRMRAYVTVDEYRLKVAALHKEINEQGKQLAVQAAELKRLDERTERKP
jgi:hypothetical protein